MRAVLRLPTARSGRGTATVRNLVPILLLLLIGGTGLWGWGAIQFGDGPPDLVVEKIATDPPEPQPDEVVELIATVANRGRGRVLQPFSVFFEVDDQMVANVRVTSRPGRNARVEVRARWTAVEGLHRVVVRVDAFQEVPEVNERNNRAEIDLEVRRLEGARSLTLELYEGVGTGLHKAGEAIQVPPNDDLLLLFEAFKTASQKAGEAFAVGADRLELVPTLLPPSLRGEAQLRTGGEIAAIYRSLTASFAQVNDGLERLNLQLLTTAFRQVREDLATLSTYALEGVSLRSLEGSIALMDQALARAEELQQAAQSGNGEVDTNAAVQELLDVLTQIGQEWVAVADGFVQSGSARQARFLTARGTPLERVRPQEEIVVTAPRAARLTLEIFDETGQQLFQAQGEGDSLSWWGTDSSGRPLAPGRYFYRLEVLERSGRERVELGQIFLSE